MTSRTPPIVIIGAGIGGITLALLLGRRGIDAEILEQSAELREVGAAIGLAGNGTRVLQQLGLREGLARASTEFSRFIGRDGLDGRPVTLSRDQRWYQATFGAPFVGLHRADLQQLLASALDPARLHLSCQVDSLEQRGDMMLVHSSSGAEYEASLVVGADGVHSVARQWITGGDEPVYSGTSGFRGLVPAGQLAQLPEPGALQCWMGAGAHLLHYPIAGGELINFLAVVDGPQRWTADGWMMADTDGAHLAPFAGWHPAVTEMLSAVPQSARWGLFARRPLSNWHRGPVVLLGDAAHAMLPHHGQGAAQTIEDAAVLAAELSRSTDGSWALRRYQDRRLARTRKVQLMSWDTSAALHLPPGPAARRRDEYLAGLHEHVAWIHGFDALAH